MNKVSLYIIGLMAFVFTSCKNKLNVIAPGKEMVSIYGVLNPNDAVQNIRINKVFVTDGDANTAAQDANAINYNAGELIVTLERYNTGSDVKLLTTQNNSVKKEIVLTETVVTTNTGAFSTQQRIWQTNDKLYFTGEYKIVVKKASDNTVISTAQTPMVDSLKPFSNVMPFCFYYNSNFPNQSYPMHGGYVPDSPPGSGTKQLAYVDYSVTSKNQYIWITGVANAKMYNITVRFHYIDTLLSGSAIDQYADFTLKNYVADKIQPAVVIKDIQFNANDFYTNLVKEINSKGTQNVKKRKSDYIEYIVSGVSENLYTYLQVNTSSNTIAQDKPYYTNVTNGVGIFGSKATTIVTKDLWSSFVDKISCYPTTYPYKFCNFTTGNPAVTTCP